MSRILHITQCLTKGGAGRSLVATAKYSARLGAYQHKAISLVPVRDDIADIIRDTDLELVNAPGQTQIFEEIQAADIVQVHFWNNPNIYEFLRSELPAMRLLVWVWVAAHSPPQVIIPQLVDYADITLGCSEYTCENSVFTKLSAETRNQKTGMVFGGTDFDRCTNFEKKPHRSFNIGYIGTVDFVKLHPQYVRMSASINIPEIKIITVGRGRAQSELLQQIDSLEKFPEFEFIDYLENIKPILEILDVFGYPLCEETYAASELVLQEVMYCGIPPVVFPYGGLKHLVIHNETGLIVANELEYKQAIEYLYHHPEERQRLGENARKYAHQHFGAKNAIQQLHPIYEKLLEQPKRQRQWSTQPRSGAECFVESLGETAPHFRLSLTSQDTEVLLASEQQIACSSPFVQRGILNYVSHYSDDANLNLWAGLISQRLGQYSQAISELSMAIALGCSHWRALWYLAQTAERAGDLGLARKTLLQLWASHPKMAVVRGTYTRLFNCPVSLLPQRFLLEKALNLLKVLVKSPKHFVKMSLMAIRDRFSILLTFPNSNNDFIITENLSSHF